MERELRDRIFFYWLDLPEEDYLFNAAYSELLKIAQLLGEGNEQSSL